MEITNCPRCHAPRVDIEGQENTGLHEFTCGSWWDNQTSPIWDRDCTRAALFEQKVNLVFESHVPDPHIEESALSVNSLLDNS